jgi:hypothetical protein
MKQITGCSGNHAMQKYLPFLGIDTTGNPVHPLFRLDAQTQKF